MKKMMLALGLILTLTVTSAFAGEVKVSSQVLESFKKEFSTAQDVSWIAGSNFYRAAFKINEQNIFAYYTLEGELISMARYMSSLQLPINLLTGLKKDYSQYWISDLFEVNNSEGTRYYITLENADATLMMVSNNGGDWKSYNKKRKI
jgi:hypothetical protein